MIVLFSPEIQEYFYKLENILYEKGYFSHEYKAFEYVDALIFEIKNNLPEQKHRLAPPYYDKYGKGLYYAVFKKNRNTHYYAFFSKYIDNGNTVFLVCYIGNNHTDAQYL